MSSSDAWVADIGNTRIAIARVAHGVFQGPTIRLPALAPQSDLPSGGGLPLHVVSVHPRLRTDILRNLGAAGFCPVTVWGEDRAIPVRHTYLDGSQPGADRLAGAYAAWRRTGTTCVVVDAGTAVTVDVIGADGVFAGGAIAPGVRALAVGLENLAPGLPKVALPTESRAYPGQSTRDCLELGLLAAAEGLLGNLVRRALAFAGPGSRAFVTGGDAVLVARYVPEVEFERADDLVLEGVAAFADLSL